jgi:hypothetical protein
MKLELDRSLDLPVPAAAAWRFLDRIEAVAACLPGAAITETIDETHYRGTVSVRLGPVNLVFGGVIEIRARDPATRTMTLAGKGSDKSGTSVAEMEMTAAVIEAGAQASRVEGKASVTVNGKAAALGARMMDSVSEQLIKEFYANLLTAIEAEAPAADAQVAPTAEPAPAVAPPRSLNGLAFIWAVLKSFFVRKSASGRISP